MDPPRTSDDVRMRGFAGRTTVEEALAWIDRAAGPLETERCQLAEAHGRVLAEELTAAVDVPPFDRSAMDGYALRADETLGAGSYNPLALRLLGESLPGRPFAGAVGPGTAVRIMTGAPVPEGADAVLPAEYAEEQGDRVQVSLDVSPGKHIGRRGEDVRAGAVLLTRGRRLRPQDVGLAASIGRGEVEVVRRPRVRIVATGNELATPGTPVGAHQIYDSNTSTLRGLIARDGGTLEQILVLADDREAIRAALAAPGCDVLLVSGGSSVGKEDHAPLVLAAEGELAIHGVAMRPSSPSGMGRIGRTLVFLLPGNPVSCLCAYDFFAGRAVRLLGGRDAAWPYRTLAAPLAHKIVSAVGRVDYCRVRLEKGRVEPLAISGASVLSSTTRADGFVIVPASLEGYAPGTAVDVFLYDLP